MKPRTVHIQVHCRLYASELVDGSVVDHVIGMQYKITNATVVPEKDTGISLPGFESVSTNPLTIIRKTTAYDLGAAMTAVQIILHTEDLCCGATPEALKFARHHFEDLGWKLEYECKCSGCETD